MGSIAYFSICSANYLPYAVTLFRSLRRVHPEVDFTLFMVDAPQEFAGLPPELKVVFAEDIGIPTFWDMAFRYTVMEFNTAVKPFCFAHLFRMGHAAAIYLDPDIYVTKRPTPVEDALRNGENCVLTPHSLAPLDDGMDPDDVRLLRTGVYNLGFGAFANTPEVHAFLGWWGGQLAEKCVVDLAAGLFVDQKFVDLAPAYLSRCMILRDAGMNVAYWNLVHRKIWREGDTWKVNEGDLYFFHFSGVMPSDPTVVSKHQNRFTRSNVGGLIRLLDVYLADLKRNDVAGWSSIRYAYDGLATGEKIIPEIRRVYARSSTKRKRSKTDFGELDTALLNEREPEIRADQTALISRLMWEIWNSRDDLRLAFSTETIEGRFAFMEWYVLGGHREHNVPAACVDPIAKVYRDRQTQSLAVSRPAVPLPSKLYLAVARFVRPVFRGLPRGLRSRLRPALIGLGVSTAPKRQPQVSSPRLNKIDPSLQEGIGVFGYIAAETGVAEGARRALAALQSLGRKTSIHLVDSGSQFANLDSTVVSEAREINPHRINLFHINADQTVMLPLIISPENLEGRYNIGYWAWELPDFPAEWHGALDHVDEVWVPSNFVRHAVSQVTDKPVLVIPHPLAKDGLPVPAKRRKGKDAQQCRFLSTLDFNSYFARKNPAGSIVAFKSAFPDETDDSVALILKTHGHTDQFANERRELLSLIEGDRRITLIDRVMTRDELTVLQNDIDVFVSLHRSEGFGLNIAECMGFGKPVITTAFSGPTDFANRQNAVPVGFSMIPVGDAYPFGQGQWWAEPDIAEAAKAMRRLATDPVLRQTIGAAAAESVRQNLSMEAIARRMDSRLREIEDQIIPSRLGQRLAGEAKDWFAASLSGGTVDG